MKIKIQADEWYPVYSINTKYGDEFEVTEEQRKELIRLEKRRDSAYEKFDEYVDLVCTKENKVPNE